MIGRNQKTGKGRLPLDNLIGSLELDREEAAPLAMKEGWILCGRGSWESVEDSQGESAAF